MAAFIDIEERNKELFMAYIRAFRDKNVGHAEAVRIAIHSACSRYWISPDYIYREILTRLKPRSQNIRSRPRRGRKRLYDKMFADFLALRNKTTFRGYSAFFLSTFLVNRPAPGFYLSYDRACKIIRQMRKKNSIK